VTPVQQEQITVLDPLTYGNGDPAQNGLPHDQYDWLRTESPVHLARLEDPMVIDEVYLLSRYEDVVAADRDVETYSTAHGFVNIWRFNPIDPTQGGKPAMLALEGADHRRNRKVISRGFTPKVVAAFESHLRILAKEIVDQALERRQVNFVTDVAQKMPLRAICDLVGVPEEKREQFIAWVNTMASPFDPRCATSIEDVVAAIQGLFAYALELAEDRRVNPGEDVMSKVVAAQTDETLSEDELMGAVVLLANGGSETTRAALSHGMLALINHPDQTAWLRERKDDIPATAPQEIIRWASPVIHMCRTLTRDVELHGVQMSEGDRVALLWASANFDPEQFEDPKAFKLDRSPNEHTAFGRGPHACLGKHIAALEIKVLMEELLSRTKEIRLAGEPSYVRDSFARGVYELPVELVPA